jgi:hypothetical protein
MRHPAALLYDYLSLLKIDGRWQVAQKVFAWSAGSGEGRAE